MMLLASRNPQWSMLPASQPSLPTLALPKVGSPTHGIFYVHKSNCPAPREEGEAGESASYY